VFDLTIKFIECNELQTLLQERHRGDTADGSSAVLHSAGTHDKL
jgi:hypothetical protein